MGYLNNSTVTIDAILTKKGRELLAKGDGSFKITQFALADDEIDYTLYNPSHPEGSAFFGQAIENMPVLEAFPDEQQIMKYKLVTLPRGTAKMPVLSIGFPSISLNQGASISLTPETLNYLGNTSTNESSGYSVTIGDVRLLSQLTGTGINTDAALNANTNSTTTVGTNVSKTVIGTQFKLFATTLDTLFSDGNDNYNTSIKTTLTVVGLDSGARVTIPLEITKKANS